MAHYAYQAMDAQGRLSRGWLEAADPAELARRLQSLGLQLIRARRHRYALLRPQVKRSELITLFLMLEQLTRSGVPLLDALGGIRDSQEGAMKPVVATLLDEVGSGLPLSQAMARQTAAFDPVCISLVRAGEESGRLHEVFRQLADALKWRDELAAHTRNLLLYPAFVAITVAAITIFMLVWLVPQLSTILLSLGQPIPWQTRWLLTVSELFRQFWLVIPLSFAMVGGAWLVGHQRWQRPLDGLRLRLWWLGDILRKIILARFANTFAMLYASGISVLDSLALCRNLAGNQVIAQGLANIAEEIAAGRPLTQSFQRTGLFPPLVLQMLKVGEATGNLDQALLNVSYFYSREVQEAIRRLQTLLEPALTLLLGLILGWVMLSVLLPVYDIISQVKLR
jgi:type IV pilus assembly protein PilC